MIGCASLQWGHSKSENSTNSRALEAPPWEGPEAFACRISRLSLIHILVEFSDFECPHCKEAQPIIAKLLADYPSAHFVYQDFPLVQIHTEALKAATHGYCVAKAGNDAFFKFSDALFATQAGLTPATSDATLKDAETKAGQDPAKIAACAETAAAKDAIKASLALGEQVGVNSTPTLFVNGRGLPIVGIPYAMLQKIIEYQAQLDGVPVPPAPPAPPEKPAPSLR